MQGAQPPAKFSSLKNLESPEALPMSSPACRYFSAKSGGALILLCPAH